MMSSNFNQHPTPRLSSFCLRVSLILFVLAAMQSAAAAQTVVGTITRPGLRPWSLAVYEAGNKVFIGDVTTNHLLIYDGNSLSLLGELTIPGGAGDSIMIVDEARGKLYLSNSGSQIIVVNAVTNTVIGPITISGGGYIYDKDEGLGRVYAITRIAPFVLYAINTADDSVSTVSLSSAGLTTGLGVNPVTHEIFVGYLQGNSLDIIDGMTLTRTTVAGVNGRGIAVNWLENKVYGTQADYGGYWIHDRDAHVTIEVSSEGDNDRLAFNPTSNRIYSDSEIFGRCSIIEGSSDTLFDLPMESGAVAVAVRHATNHVYLANTTAILILDDPTELVETIPISNPTPDFAPIITITVNQTTGRIFVVNDADTLNAVTVVQDTETMIRPPVYIGSKSSFKNHVLDPISRTVADTWYPAYPAHGLAVRPGGGRIYEATYQSFSFNGALRIYGGVAGSVSSNLLAYFETGGDDPTVPAVTPDGSRVYVTNSASNNVSVINTATNSVITTIPVGTRPWGIAVTPNGAKAYVANKVSNTVSVINTATNMVVKTITVGAQPWGVAINPGGTRVYIANSGSGTVSVIDSSTDTAMMPVTVGTTPHWLACTPNGKSLYVSNRSSGTVSVIATDTNQVTQTVTVGANPEGIAAMPDGSEVYVVNSNTSAASSLSIINTSSYAVATVTLPSDSLESIALAIADPTSKFAGRVTSGGAPVSGALVRALQSGIEKGAALTDANGDYSIFNLKPGTYDLEASAIGFDSQTVTAQVVGAGRTTIVNFAFCAYAISPNSAFFPVTGSEGGFNLAAAPGCSWTATSNDGWIELTSEASGSGPAAISYIVRDNFSPIPRVGTITIAGLTFTITQDSETAPDCTYNIFPLFESHPANGGAGSINVVTDERCAWQAVSDASWITITSGCCGIGSGSVTYSVAANPSPSGRAGTITIGGRTFNVKQKGP